MKKKSKISSKDETRLTVLPLMELLHQRDICKQKTKNNSLKRRKANDCILSTIQPMKNIRQVTQVKRDASDLKH